jgi:hypothetical protein
MKQASGGGGSMIGGGGPHIHILVLCVTNFFSEIGCCQIKVCEHEYVNMSPPIIDLPPPLKQAKINV